VEAGSWTDIIAIGIALLALFGATGVAWVFSKKSRARSRLNRMGVDISDESLMKRIEDHDARAVELLLCAGVRSDVRVGGREPVEVAIESRNETALRLLLEYDHSGAVAAKLIRVPQAATGPSQPEPREVPTQRLPGPTGELRGLELPDTTIVLSSVQDVLDHMQRVAQTELKGHELTEVRNFGLDLEVVATFILYRMIFQSDFRDISYQGLIVDGASERIQQIIDGESSIHSGTASAVIEKVNNQLDGKSLVLARRHVSIEIRRYAIPPVVHGFLVGDSHLYLGFTEFSNGKLQGGQFPYLYVRADESDAMSSHLFRVYRSWFDYYWKQSPKVCKS